jgi:hypothetical protein
VKKFNCGNCNNTVYFENVSCLHCGHALGFNPEHLAIVALEPIADHGFREVKDGGTPVRYCANAAHGVCNWLVADDAETGFCRACSLNRIIPNLSDPANVRAWADLERAKKRLVYSLMRFGLPLEGAAYGKGPLNFDFVSNALTGHVDGVITIAIMEADAVERERQRQQMAEAYRSLLGHLRHESGHYYWMLLVESAGRLEEFRRLFGDEREDYQAALVRHHDNGPPPDWQTRHVSAYASSHPWEDWAETWAHYLHMVDALDTAEAQGIEPRAAGFFTGSVWPFNTYDVYRSETFDALMERWIPLTLALNSLNRSMGNNDFYPFIIPPTAITKLDFVHRVIRQKGK